MIFYCLQLATNTPDGEAMLKDNDWFIVPYHNADGYEYSVKSTTLISLLFAIIMFPIKLATISYAKSFKVTGVTAFEVLKTFIPINAQRSQRYCKMLHLIVFLLGYLSDLPHINILRGSYMGTHVFLKIINELEKRFQMRGLLIILSLFRNEFNKFNNTGVQMLDSIYQMILSLLCK